MVFRGNCVSLLQCVHHGSTHHTLEYNFFCLSINFHLINHIGGVDCSKNTNKNIIVSIEFSNVFSFLNNSLNI